MKKNYILFKKKNNTTQTTKRTSDRQFAFIGWDIKKIMKWVN